MATHLKRICDLNPSEASSRREDLNKDFGKSTHHAAFEPKQSVTDVKQDPSFFTIMDEDEDVEELLMNSVYSQLYLPKPETTIPDARILQEVDLTDLTEEESGIEEEVDEKEAMIPPPKKSKRGHCCNCIIA